MVISVIHMIVVISSALAGDAPLQDDLATLVTPYRADFVEETIDLPVATTLKNLANQRDKQLAAAEKMTTQLFSLLHRAEQATAAAERSRVERGLRKLAGELPKQRKLLERAIELEISRLEALRAVLEADGSNSSAIDQQQLRTLHTEMRSDLPRDVMNRRTNGYEALAVGAADFLAGRFAPALEHFRRASKALPEIVMAHAFHGSLAYVAGAYEEAQLAWRRALQLEPDNDRLIAALDEVKIRLAP